MAGVIKSVLFVDFDNTITIGDVLDAVIEREPERSVFGLVPPGPQAKYEAPSAYLVDRCGLLREHRRIVEPGARHERPQRDPFGDGSQRADCGRFERSLTPRTYSYNPLR